MKAPAAGDHLKFVVSGGEMADLIRDKDWRSTSLGSPASWPQSLRTALSILLHSKFPMFLFWGEDLISFYNDAYRPSFGNNGMHPDVLGKPAHEAWADIWDIVKKYPEQVLQTGEATWQEDLLIPIYRNGKMEDVYWTFSHSPVYDAQGEIEGIFVMCMETTDKVKVFRELKIEKEQTEFTINAAELGTWDYNPITDTLSANDRMKQWFGLPLQGEILFRNALQSIHPKDQQRIKDAIKVALQFSSGGSYDQEYTVVNPLTLQERIIHAKGKAYFNRYQLADRFIGTLEDITDRTAERLKAEHAARELVESERRFRTLADNIPMFAFIIEPNADATISYWNKTWLDYTGQTFQEALGRAWDGVVHPDDVASVLEIYVPAFINRQPCYIPAVRVRRYDGEFRWHLFKAGPRYLPDGEFMGYIGVGFDIHEQKLSEDSLKASEEQFRSLAQALPQLIWVTDEKGVQEFTSFRWQEYTGLEPHGEHEWQAIVHPEDYEAINAAWAHSLTHGSIYRADVRLKSKEGDYRWHSVLGEPVRDAENKIIKWVGAFTDVHYERSFLQQLELQVEKRTEQLNEAKAFAEEKNKELEKVNKELESFAYISSHDLQEPLRKIQTFSARIAEHDADSLSAYAKDKFQRMKDAARRMQLLIEDLLVYSRTTTSERRFETINLNAIVEEVKEDLNEELLDKGASIQVHEGCYVTVIHFQFRQLLHNLVSNSLKFVKPGQAPLIEIKSKIVDSHDVNYAALLPNHTYCHISISDNGIGFDQQYHEKIFEVFQRLHGKSDYAGTGIGLAIVKKIVDNHHGLIKASGEVDKGATFDIYLPVD